MEKEYDRMKVSELRGPGGLLFYIVKTYLLNRFRTIFGYEPNALGQV